MTQATEIYADTAKRVKAGLQLEFFRVNETPDVKKKKIKKTNEDLKNLLKSFALMRHLDVRQKQYLLTVQV